MKKIIKRSLMGISFLLVLTIGTFMLCLFNPQLMYASSTEHNSFTIHHNEPIQVGFVEALDEAYEVIQSSELFSSDMHFNICLNDGGYYYNLHETFRGQAFGYGFSDIVCLGGALHAEEGYAQIHQSRWGLVDLLAHEMTHCMEFQHKGIWNSNPIAGHPTWIWEGYAEYIARPATDLKAHVGLWLEAEANSENGWFERPDGTDCPIDYFRDGLFVQYCMEERGMSFDDMLDNPPAFEEIRAALIAL